MKLINNKFLLIVISCILIILPFSFVAAQDGNYPDTIVFEAPGLSPEGIEFDANSNHFLLGSGPLTNGNIFSISLEGDIEPLITDDEFTGAVGIHIDQVNNRLIVARIDSGAMMNNTLPNPELSGVAVYDLETLERVYFTALNELAIFAGVQIINDVTSDIDGNVYATDSLSPTIYKIDPEGNASILIRDERLAFMPEEPSDEFIPNLNGLDYHPDGYLLVSLFASGEIYRVPINTPEDLSKVELNMPVSIDGMVLNSENEIIAASVINGAFPEGDTAIVRITSDDDWQTAEVVDTFMTDQFVSTVTIVDDEIYGIQPQFENITAEEYTIIRAQFGDDE